MSEREDIEGGILVGFVQLHVQQNPNAFCLATGRQSNVESRSGSFFAFRGNGAVMSFQNGFYNEQS
jgi:hypothetical protein